METLLAQLRATSPWEAIAAGLGLAYLLLAVRRSLWCWLCAFASTAIYLVLFAQAKLYMQSALNLFYLAMALYGFYEWRRGRTEEGELIVRSWPLHMHLAAVGAIGVVTAINGALLAHTFVTWSSVLVTWMVARRLIENWLYWIVIDSLAAYLYFTQQLLVTGLLFIAYVGIVVLGYFKWKRLRSLQTSTTTA
jgi:nicotinamide mononucleotide transporter